VVFIFLHTTAQKQPGNMQSNFYSVIFNLKPPSMKKPFWLVVLLCAFFSLAYSQDQNSDNNSDDTYYNGDDQQAPTDQQAPADQQQQYDDYGNPIDNTAPTYQQFYDQLSPYGTWINYPGQGYVWVPNQVPAGFSPYETGGHWTYTDEGWCWVSDYPWGWATFHYGRWFMDDVYGWMWVPGYDWAPAWVTWGDYDGYYCWAPCGPGAVIGPGYRPDARYWHFVEHGNIMQGKLNNYVLHNKDYAAHGIDLAHFNDKVNIVSNANTYHQSVYFTGPKAAEVSKYTGQKVKAVSISTTRKPGATKVNSGHVQIYRPNIARTSHQPAPARVSKPAELKQANPAEEQHSVNPAQQTPTNPAQQQTRTNPVRQTRQNVTAPKQQSQPARQQSWTPPRESAPRPAQSQPARGFIPSAAPRPSGGGGGGFHGGGGAGGGFHGGGGGGRR
jgi:uncharacterized membrane protein YgcG